MADRSGLTDPATLAAGQRCDDLIERAVYGANADEVYVRRSPLASPLVHGEGFAQAIVPIPAYSTDLNAAVVVLDRFAGWQVQKTREGYACIIQDSHGRQFLAEADTPALAACRAVLDCYAKTQAKRDVARLLLDCSVE